MAGARPLKISVPVQGWKQFLAARKEMLDAYDNAREKSKAQKVEVVHGRVAEAEFRKWLSNFLPKRFAVTPGYIISQGLDGTQKAPHYDVIIYDQLESPILWVDGSSDLSDRGRSLAIPVEFVRGVIEVKSAFSSSTVKEAVEHLADLRILLHGEDRPEERYKKYLPPQFFCAAVFFELRSSDAKQKRALNFFVDKTTVPRGLIGAVILRGEGHDPKRSSTARICICESDKPLEAFNRKGHTMLSEDGSDTFSEWGKVTDLLYLVAKLSWHEIYFPLFAFELVSRLQGTFDGSIPSFHGCGSTIWEDLKNKKAKQIDEQEGE